MADSKFQRGNGTSNNLTIGAARATYGANAALSHFAGLMRGLVTSSSSESPDSAVEQPVCQSGHHRSPSMGDLVDSSDDGRTPAPQQEAAGSSSTSGPPPLVDSSSSEMLRRPIAADAAAGPAEIHTVEYSRTGEINRITVDRPKNKPCQKAPPPILPYQKAPPPVPPG